MNYSFYDDMDELDDIINESTDAEMFIESMEELFEEKTSDSKESFDEWARSKYDIEVPFSECNFKAYTLDSKNVKTIASKISVAEKLLESMVPFKTKVYVLTHGGKPIYMNIRTTKPVKDVTNHEYVIETAYGKNAEKYIGYYSAMIADKAGIPYKKSGLKMHDKYESMKVITESSAFNVKIHRPIKDADVKGILHPGNDDELNRWIADNNIQFHKPTIRERLFI